MHNLNSTDSLKLVIVSAAQNCESKKIQNLWIVFENLLNLKLHNTA